VQLSRGWVEWCCGAVGFITVRHHCCCTLHDRHSTPLTQGVVTEGIITGYNKGGVLVELGDLKGA
jgi:hypothetical protein